jgi:hypothetical protein
MRRFQERRESSRLGGFVAGALLIVFGVVVIALGVSGRSTVQSSSDRSRSSAPTTDPSTDQGRCRRRGPDERQPPTCSVAGKAIDTGTRARCFADYMQIHTLESRAGDYAQLRFATADGRAPTTRRRHCR